jgi:4-cresol dehydrogenase (hydroxylating)
MKKMAFLRAVSQWKRVLDNGRVITETAELGAASTATYALQNRVIAIVRPRNREEVQACARIASANGVAIYPISRGKNWGYGSRVPARDACALFDLSLMDKIVDLDRSLATVTIEPGVTTLALASYLRAHAPNLVASVPTATTTGASVVGNALDGGVGGGPHGDRFAYVYSLEVVLATGEVIRTGLDRLERGARLGHGEAHVGPSVRNLFIQGNFGIVTQMTVGLFPAPGDLRLLKLGFQSSDDLAPFVETIKSLMHAQVIREPVSIYNDYELISVSVPYPWSTTYGRTPLPKNVLALLRKAKSYSRWSAFVALASFDKDLGDAHERTVRRALKGYEVSASNVTAHRNSFYFPNGVGMFGLYWRKPGGAVEDADPNRDGCGLVFLDFVMPTDPELLVQVLAHIEPLVLSYGFEPSTEVHALWQRAVYLVVSIAYDRDVPGEDERVEACDRALTRYLAQLGILPARRRVGSMDLLPRSLDDSAAVFSRIKTALDPERVVAPGRYEWSDDISPPAKVRSGPKTRTAFEKIEQVNQSLLARRKQQKSNADGSPLRPYFLGRASYESMQSVSRYVLKALQEGASSMLEDESWRKVLGIDDALASALRRRNKERTAIGLLAGAFDAKGEYKALRFDSSLSNVAESAEISAKATDGDWRSPLILADLRERLGPSGSAYTIRHSDSTYFIRSLDQIGFRTVRVSPAGRLLETTERDPLTVYTRGWKQLLSGPHAPAVRRLLGDKRIRTNVFADLLLANLAIFAYLSERADSPSSGKDGALSIERHLPWTRLLLDGVTRFRGRRIHLLEHVAANKANFVLRPMFRSDNVTWIGEYVLEADWRHALKLLVHSPRNKRPLYVVQERARIGHEVFPIARGASFEFEGYFVGVDAIVAGGAVASGCVARIAERPRVGSGSPNTHLVPTLVGP